MSFEHFNEPCHREDSFTQRVTARAEWDRAQMVSQLRGGIVTTYPQAAPPTSDQVHQPAHYARYVIEPATFIGANKLPFDVGNVIKYVCRFDAKNGREDLRKAARYIEMLIERLDREDRVAAGEAAGVVWSEML